MRRINGPCFERAGEVRAPKKGEAFHVSSDGNAWIARCDFETEKFPILRPVSAWHIDPTDVHFEACGRDEATHWERKTGEIVPIGLCDSRNQIAEYVVFVRWLRLVTVEVAETPESKRERAEREAALLLWSRAHHQGLRTFDDCLSAFRDAGKKLEAAMRESE